MRWFNKIIIGAIAIGINLSGKELLLIDTSGSMRTDRAMSGVKKIVKEYQLTQQGTIWGFNSDLYTVNSISDLDFTGGTVLSVPLQKAYDEKYKFITIVSDGEPLSIHNTKLAAKSLRTNGVKICSVYITADNKVPPILKEMSDAVFSTSDITKVFELCSETVKSSLLGRSAVKKQINNSQFNLF
jgi:hypothetical protein